MKINSASSNIYAKTAKRINNSKYTKKMLKSIEANPSLWSSLMAFSVATTIKPLSIALIPNNKEDNKYAIARSISTGIADLAMATAIFIPMKKRLDVGARKLFDAKNTIYHNNPEACTRFKSLFNRAFKVTFIPIFAWAKFVLIAPIADRMDNKESGGKNDK